MPGERIDCSRRRTRVKHSIGKMKRKDRVTRWLHVDIQFRPQSVKWGVLDNSVSYIATSYVTSLYVIWLMFYCLLYLASTRLKLSLYIAPIPSMIGMHTRQKPRYTQLSNKKKYLHCLQYRKWIVFSEYYGKK